MKKVIYLAGPITGVPDYQTRFNATESYLGWKGWTVLNPANLPEGMKPDAYMPICLAMLQAADAMVKLVGSDASEGVAIEERYARYQGKAVYAGIESVPCIDDAEVTEL